MAGFTLLALGAMFVAAQSSSIPTNSPDPAKTAVSSSSSQVKLSFGALDVLSLWAAHASEGSIISFIENSTVTYNLSATEIIYLRQQGVSDRVINTMLNHRREIAEASARVAARIQAEAMASSSRASAQNTQPETTYVQMAPTSVESPTVYVFPSSPQPVFYNHDGYYPWYGGYYGYPYPGWSLSFGFGSSFSIGGFSGSGYYHGGFHGGGHH